MRDAVDLLLEGWAAKPVKPAKPSKNPQEQLTQGLPDEIVLSVATDAATKVRSLKTPRIFPCGHTNWYSSEENSNAQAEGHCCAGVPNQAAIDWTVAGLLRPVPVRMHRVRGGKIGFPGLCCDKNGYYIGGLGNDCRIYGPMKSSCYEHQPEVEHKPHQPRPPSQSGTEAGACSTVGEEIHPIGGHG